MASMGSRVAGMGEWIRVVDAGFDAGDLQARNFMNAISSEQQNGLQQISQAMTQIDGTVQSNAATAEEIAASASVLTEQARQLTDLLGTLQGVIRGQSA